MVESKSNDKQFDRWSWLTLAVVTLFSLVVIATTLATLSMPGDGWQMVFEERPLTHFVGDWPTALREGDVVVAVDGIAVENGDHPIAPPRSWHEGVTVPYTIERDGRQQTVDVLLGKLSTRGILLALGNTMRYDFPQWTWFLAGLVVFFLRPGSPPARLLFLAGAILVVATKIGWAATTINASFAPPLLFYVDKIADSFWGWVFFPSIILFMLYFAQPIWPLTRFPNWTPALIILVPIAITFLITILTGWIVPATILLVAEMVLIVTTAVFVVLSAFRPGRDPVKRAQVSWVALGVAITVGGTLLAYLLNASEWFVFSGTLESIISLPLALAMPICLTIAILRYRLFDIEVIIRKTLVYAVLTAMLALVYFGLVVLLQSIVDAVGGQQSTIVIVISTLVIAALFAPLRRWIQDGIDRHFFRTKYDAQQVLKQYIESARNETDMDVLTAKLEHAVREALQPAIVGVWLRDPNQAFVAPHSTGSLSD